MRRSYLFLTVCYLLAVILAGCGGGSGSAGSSGSETTGIQIQAVTISSDAGPDFDVFSAPLACPADNPTGPEALLHREDAVISITCGKAEPPE